MKTATTPVAVEYGVALVALSVPVAVAGFHFANLVHGVFTILLARIDAVTMVIGT